MREIPYTKPIKKEQKMFQRINKNYQSKKLANTWQQSLRNRQIAKNNFQVHGDIKKANAFVQMVANYSFVPVEKSSNEKIIFSLDSAVAPAYTM